MLIERVHHNGNWVVSDMIDGYLVTRTYYGYTKKQAAAEFKREMREETNHVPSDY